MRAASALLAFLLTAVAPAPGLAQSPPAPIASTLPAGVALAQSRIDAMLRTGHADAAWFSADFLAEISVDKVDAVIGSLTKSLGAYRSIEYAPEKFIAHFARGIAYVLIHFNADQKIDELVFRQPLTPAAVALAQNRVDTMLRTGHADPAWFSADFLKQISVDQVDAVIANLTKSLGAYKSLEYTSDRFVAHFEKGTTDVLIHLDANEKIDSLLFRPPSTL
jgi:hypothetical protein